MARRIGPTAQDFYAASGTGGDNEHIGSAGANGVALAAIQGLNEELNECDAKIAALEARLQKLDEAASTRSASEVITFVRLKVLCCDLSEAFC